jgi:tRNA(fMet)-specific endonuclease VapC
MYVLDTNTLIYFFKGTGNVAAHLLATPLMEVAIPAIVVYGLKVGIAKSRSPEKCTEQLVSLLAIVNVLPFGLPETTSAVQIRADLERQGAPIGPYDVLIAAIALANNATLVTHNTDEFSRIAGLKIVDWFV